MSKLSVSIITLNEEENLRKCLDSVKGIADEIIVVDSGSTDKTGEIAEAYGARFIHNDWPGHVIQKQFAMEKCSGDWILSLDADECLTPELADEIKDIINAENEITVNGFFLNRRNYYMGKWIWHAWYPEWRARLVRKGKGRWTGTDPHDSLSIEGPTKKLRSGDFLHYSYRDLRHHLDVTVKYARIGAQSELKKGKTFNPVKLIFSPIVRVLKDVFVKMAWRDGWRGWIILFNSMMSAFLKQAFLFEESVKKEKKN